MIQYLLTSTITATILLVLYQLFLEKEKMHRFNRFYLLISLIFSLLIPFISIEIIEEITTPMSAPIPMSFSEGTMVIAEENNYLEQILWGIYVLVTAILSFRFTRNIITFYQLKKNNTTLSFQNATLVLLQEPVLPHTFMNSIFINEAEYQERKIEKELFAHEMTHVNQKHTLDVLFIELIKTIFWFNPLYILYKKAIQLNHEFLADEKVVQSYQNIPFYQSLLLSKASCNPPLYLASNLNFQVTKKRFLMMSRNSSKKIIVGKQIFLLPVFVTLFYNFCIKSVAQNVPAINVVKLQSTPKNINRNSNTQNLSVKTQNNTRDKKMSLLEEGSILKTTLINNSSASDNRIGRSEAKTSLILKSNTKDEKRQNAALSSEIEDLETKTKNTVYNTLVLNEKPDFPGGMLKFYRFVGENYQVPTEFKTSGRLYVKFMIETDGSLSNFSILKDIGYGTGEEAIRVLKKSPKWIPGKKDGVPVRVEYSMPITIQTPNTL